MMFEQIRDDFKKGSERMKTQAQQLGRTPARIRARKRWAIQQLRHRARMSQGSGQEWLFEIQTDTLHRVEGMIEGAPELPLFQRFLDNAEQRVNERDCGVRSLVALHIGLHCGVDEFLRL